MIELVSIHIPKTAGRSFLDILNAVYGSTSIAHFDRKDYVNKTIPELEQFKFQLNNKIHVIHGHFQYKEIGDLKNINSAKVITWLRNPVERVISNFSFFRKRISQAVHDAELQKRRKETLIDYATMENSRNRMSKFIEGLDLKDFFFIGITEHFDEDVQILAKLLNWGPFQIPRINDNTSYKSQLPPVTIEEIKIIERLNLRDIELYSKALKIRNKRIN